ncbi:hypothetical protein Ae406Ps2_2878 [Pseudonocardia sp. Ae406_Ps2]|nr:hypothetical protein Ae331Ps2_3047c [Pseudonocardia sp. Ae331_Ps2]OLM02878.1 hypothetical protein Ae406Ps2_2878 [Pseudonocardia sp. Ae406_Ps2]OLM12287.1 hypothetical protein Ae505Ps2_2415c [Pseudonocardia sp. Ae505_Ps2]OLM24457.1 hypothetical protein Ae706Ps2_2890 [Pseudonocardia sp. Ae706_Ps2]
MVAVQPREAGNPRQTRGSQRGDGNGTSSPVRAGNVRQRIGVADDRFRPSSRRFCPGFVGSRRSQEV